MNDAVKQALAKVVVEERRLQGELDKVHAVRIALEKQLGIGQAARALSRKNAAPPGALASAILGTLSKSKPMSRKAIIQALAGKEYPYSLEPVHVTKNLLMLGEQRLVKRVGNDRHAAYLKKGA